VVIHEASEIRHMRREDKYLAFMKTQSNRIHAKDIVSYQELEDTSRESPPPRVPQAKAQKNGLPVEAVDERFFEGNVAYDEDQ